MNTRSIWNRVYSRLRRRGECWQWVGAKTSSGYGSIRFLGKNYSVHRIIYMFYHGVIPPGKVIMHICDNKICCEPKHLLLGTQKENMNDASKKGRLCKHSKHCLSLSQPQPLS